MSGTIILPNAEPTYNVTDPVNIDDKITNTVEFEGANYNLDDQGNLVKSDGSVFLSKSEYETKLNPEPGNGANDATDELKIDGVVYKLDANGNALDKDGNVFKTKDELESLYEEPVDDATIETIQKLTGLELTDADGNPITYDYTPEGIAQYVTDSHDFGVQL
jgi:hypothetical protein